MPIEVMVGSTILAAFACLFSIVGASECRKNCRRFDMVVSFAIAASAVAFISGGITYLATREVLSAFYVAGIVAATILSPLPMANYVFTLSAKNYYEYAHKTTIWASDNFAKVAYEGTNFVTASDIERALRKSDTTEEERKYLAFLSAHLLEIGHVVDTYRSYTLKFGTRVIETPEGNSVYGITQNDLDSFLERLRGRTDIGGWLPSHMH